MGLVERIEAAEGPCRELDAEIARCLGWTNVVFSGRPAVMLVGDRPDHARHIVPMFSKSIDAALTLIDDEKLEWELFCYDGMRDPRFGRFQARIMLEYYEDDPEELGPQAIANASNAALALTAAALRARGVGG